MARADPLQLLKCNQCHFVSSQPDNLIKHLNAHSSTQGAGFRPQIGIWGRPDVISSVDSCEGSRHPPSLIFLPLEWRESCHVPPPQPVMAVVCGTAPPTHHSLVIKMVIVMRWNMLFFFIESLALSLIGRQTFGIRSMNRKWWSVIAMAAK